MRRFLVATAIAVFASLTVVTAADACSRNVSAQAARTAVPTKGIDQALLDRAVRKEVNFHRCRAGLPQLDAAGMGLTKQTTIHSRWMAKNHKLSHKSNVRGSNTLRNRIKSAGMKVRTGSENIGMVNRYQIDNRRFRILNANACQFAANDGTPLPAHSYASLARVIVDLWMNSPGHRRNILDRNVSHVSTAVAFDPRAQYCGRFWLTQAFIG
jgi:uncharacterized protein YkwD